jgi:glycosyltransferase involved in cell wall biosynthesis
VPVSVIIPCHDDGRHIGAALQSILDQSCRPAEIIVVDDGSTDDSAAVVRSFGAAVRLVTQPRLGVSAARNAGVAAAAGTIIGFLDADDLWPADSLRLRLERLDAPPPVDCVFGLIEQFVTPDMPPADAARLHCPSGPSPGRHAGAMLIRRSVIHRIGGFDPAIRIGEIMDFVARLEEDGAPVGRVEALVMRRRIHGRNTMIQNREAHGEYLRVLRAGLARRAARRDGGAG